ncbi:MAG TPA: DUF222 domain-containing protein [Mycobacteriales bacterium]|nr:DUF222 domain-containing protein [Mycobacteriales bacterium]
MLRLQEQEAEMLAAEALCHALEALLGSESEPAAQSLPSAEPVMASEDGPPSWCWDSPAPLVAEVRDTTSSWWGGAAGQRSADDGSRGVAPPAETSAWDTSARPGVDPALQARWAAPGVPRPSSAAGAGPVSAGTDPGLEVQALVAAIDALAAVDPASLPGEVALARSRTLLQQGERLKVLGVQSLADVEKRKLHVLDDAPSMPAWVKSLHVPGVDAAQVTLARRMRGVPQIATELTAGRMSDRTAGLLTRTIGRSRAFLDRPDGLIDGKDGEAALAAVAVDGVLMQIAEQIGGADDAQVRLDILRQELTALNDPAQTQLARWEAALIVFARECDPELLPSGIGLLVDALLPAEHDKRAEQVERERELALIRDSAGTGGTIKGRVDAELFELLATTLAAAAVTDPAGPDDTRRHAEGRQELGDDVDVDEWPVEQPRPRSKGQQRHDALKRGLRELLDSGVLGVRGKTAPHIAVIVPLGFLEGLPGALPARTEHGLRLSREQVRRMAGGSLFTRLVLDARNRVVEVSHTQRTSTALERLILKVQGGCTCSGAGCARGPATGHRLIPHHASLFSKTGTTELDDTVLLCELTHDHHLHDQRRNIRLKDGRVLGPDGSVRP